MVKLMSEIFKKSDQWTLWDSLNATSLLALLDGQKLFDSPDGPQTAPSGQAHRPANPSAKPASSAAKKTRATSGHTSAALLLSARLQSSLESKLQARLDVDGSPEYALTWKRWDMESGPQICALRAQARKPIQSVSELLKLSSASLENLQQRFLENGGSRAAITLNLIVNPARPTSDSGFTGWRSPDSNERGGDYADPAKALARMESGHQINLADQAVLAGWCSPTAQDGARGNQPPRPWDTGVPLSQQVTLAGWGTPRVANNGGNGNPERACDGQARLEDQVQGIILGGWPTPTAANADGSQMAKGATLTGRRPDGTKATVSLNVVARGVITNSSIVSTEKRGALNPAFSAWLMGFPAGWDSCGATAMQSVRKQRRNLSKRRSKQ